MTRDQIIDLEIQVRTLSYAKRAILAQYQAAKERENEALAATPLDWQRFNQASAEAFALAGALGSLGVSITSPGDKQ